MADFMEYQVQQQGYPRRRRTAQSTQPGQTPFMPNGQPLPQQGGAQQPSNGQPTSQQPTPPPGMEGWVSYGNGGWAPPGHPAAVQAQQLQPPQPPPQQAPPPRQQQPPPQAPPQQAAPPPQQPVDPKMGAQGTVNAQGVYTAGQAPTQTYQAQNIPQFSAPDLSAIQGPQMQLIQQLLSNPQTMNPQVVEQLKGREQDTAALMERQMRDQMMGSLAARGISTDSPYAQGMLRNLQANTSRGLLDSYRDIDINAIGQNRSDMLNVANMADTFQNSALGRAVTAYQPQLAALGEQRSEQQMALDSLMQRFGVQEGMLGNQAQSLRAAIEGDRAAGFQERSLGQQDRSLGQQDRSLGIQDRSLSAQIADQIANRDQRSNEFSRSLGFEQEKFGYAKEQDALQRQLQEEARKDAMAASSAAANAAEQRWIDQQAMAYQQQQEQEWNQLMAILMSGGGGF